MKTQPCNAKLRYNAFNEKKNKKTFLMKLNMINCILLVLPLLVSMVLLKCRNSISSLFTNISLQETIDIAINLIFDRNSNLTITKKELKNLFLFATSKTHFVFNSRFYNQVDGLAIGSPLAPVLANIFMGFHESKWLNEYNLNKSKFCLRYFDDILAAFDNEQDSLNFFNFLNNRHPNIKFIIEKKKKPFILFQVSMIKISHF